VNQRIVIFLGVSIAGTTLLLISTYKDYAKASETIMILVGLIASLLSIWQFFTKD
jgi:hypothetical protein